ncbi:MAG: amino acid adenylation domain-containing protein, partial [bacterium]|nr:amino acid adenylation domain-containing protein [bacterium]
MTNSKKIDKKQVEDIISLTPLQEGMLFHYLKDPESPQYFEQLCLTATGRLDMQRFNEAWQIVVTGNQMLRTLFRWEDRQNPVQVVLRQGRLQPVFHDLSKGTETEKQRRLEEIKIRDREEAFDLRDVPFRVALCKLDETGFAVLISHHHILYDGWSNGIVLREFLHNYTELSAGKKPAPPGKTNFKEYVRWLKSRDSDGNGEKQDAYWREYLEDFESASGLTVKRKSAAEVKAKVNGKGTQTHYLRLDAGEKDRLEEFVRQRKVTLAVLFNASWGLLLQRYNNIDDVLFGTTISGRSAPINAIEDMVGLFINTLPMRLRELPGETVAALLPRVDESLKTRTPFESSSLVRIKAVSQLDGREELFDNVVVIENYPLSPDLKNSGGPVSFPSFQMNEMTHYDLTLGITLGEEEGIDISFHYNDRVLDAPVIKNMACHFRRIINHVSGHPGDNVSAIEMLTPAEKAEIIDVFNNTDRDYPQDNTLHQLFRRQAEQTPDRVAVVGAGTGQMTYGELNRKSRRLARRLVEKGVQTGDIVGIMTDRSVRMLIGLLGILKSGGAYLPIDPKLPRDRINYMLTDSRATVLLTVKDPSQIQWETVYLDDFDKSSTGNREPADNDVDNDADNDYASASSLAYVIYTSGSTGRPKGVMVEHRPVVNLLTALQEQYPLTGPDTYLLKTSYTFDVSVTELFGWFWEGGRLAVAGIDVEKDPAGLLEVIEKQNVTHINFVPSMFSVFTGALTPGNVNRLSRLRYLFLAGEALLPEMVEKFRRFNTNILLENLYGPTEGTVYAGMYSLSRWDGTGSIPIGKPLPNIKLYVLDKNHHLQPIGVPGELGISGAGVARGYLNRPELTKEKFEVQSSNFALYHTGDLARWLFDGNIEFLGRIDHQVKIRGFRIEPGEIENQLLTLEHIKEAVVLVRENKAGDKYLCAYAASERKMTVTQIEEYLASRLPPYMVPSFFILLETMPLTSSGKVDRKALPEPEIKTGPAYTPPENNTQQQLLDIWSELLAVEPRLIGIDSDFFKLGGHSLKVTGLIGKIHKTMQVEIPFDQIFKSPTIRRLDHYIQGAGGTEYHGLEPAGKREYYPLSSPQERMYILYQVDPGTIAYNMPSLMILEGSVDIRRLETMFKTLIRRHDSLRTFFEFRDNQPQQGIEEDPPFKIEYQEDEGAINEFVRPFKLSRAPLFRVGIIKLRQDGHILLVDMHHIITDGTSAGILIREFMALWAGEELAPLTTRYVDFACWQTRMRDTPAFKAREDYWLKVIEGELPVLNIPHDYRRPVIPAPEGDTVYFEIDEAGTSALNRLAGDLGVTLFMVLLAVYNLLLSKISRQQDILVGIATAGRRHEELRDVIGMFVNTLVLRSFPQSGLRFVDYLAQLKERTLQAFLNQDYPFDMLVEKADTTIDPGRNPFFDTVFALENMDIPAIEIPGLTLSPYEYSSSTAKFDMTVICKETENRLVFSVEYRTSLFKEETVTRFNRYFKKLLSDIPAQSHREIWEMSIKHEDEKQQILYHFNNTQTDYPKDQTIRDLFERQVERTPDRVAVVGPDHGPRDTGAQGFISFRALNAKANRLARRLNEKGVQPGSNPIVGLMVNRSILMIIGILGILKAGAAYLPIESQYPPERINYMLQDSNTRLLLSRGGLEKKVPGNCEILDLDDAGTYSDSGENPARQPDAPGDLAYVIFTSGSTGKPKGVLTMHYNVTRVVLNTNYIQLDPGDRVLQWSNFAFDGSVFDIYGALLNGAALVLLPEASTAAVDLLAGIIHRQSITVFFVTTALFNLLVDEQPRIFDNIRKILFGGERVSVEHTAWALESARSDKIIHVYGPTETTVYATYYPIDEVDERAVTVPIGRPLANTAVYILNNRFLPVAIGVTGELYIGGLGTARGYLNRQDLTMERFIPNPFLEGDRLYKTGDLGRWLSDGNIEFVGRIDHQVKIRGFRIELGEIESQLLKYPGLKEAVVNVMGEQENDRSICAYYVPVQGNNQKGPDSAGPISSSQLIDFLSQSIPQYMIPAFFVELEEIPLTPNGKVDIKALPEPGPDIGKDYTAPSGETQEKLVELWAEVLGRNPRHSDQLRESLGIDDNFFTMGGHSIKGVKMMTRIRETFNVKISLKEIFQFPTIREVSRYIDGAALETHKTIQPAEEKDYYPLSSAQRRLYVLQQMGGGGIGYNIPSVMTLEGNVDKERLEVTFQTLVRRHESLRTSFQMLEGEPVQRVHDEVEFEIERLGRGDPLWSPLHGNHSGINGNNPGTHGGMPLHQEFVRPFDLSKAPLFRAGLAALGETRYLLMVDMHHIISDGTSIAVLVKEFMSLYGGEELPLPGLRYRDFSQWQNSPAAADALNEQETYWLSEFEGEIPVLTLPVDHPRPTVHRFEGSRVGFDLDHQTIRALIDYSLEEGTTLFMLLLSIYTIFFSRISGQEDIVVGTPVAGRSHAHLEPIIGMFVNTLGLRNDTSGDPPFSQFLQQVRQRTLAAFDNQDYLYEDLVEKLDLDRDTGRNPLFDTVFSLQNLGIPRLELPDITLTPYNYDGGTAKFDLTLEVAETGDGLSFTFEYSTKLFKRETVQRFIGYFTTLVTGVLESPGSSIEQLEIMPEEEKRKVLEDFNGRQMDYPQDRTIHSLVGEQAERNPDRLAVTRLHASLSYRELDQRSLRLAHRLKQMAVQPGHIVAILSGSSLEGMIGILAILKAGAAYLPIDPEYPRERIDYMLKDSGAKVIVDNGLMVDRLDGLKVERLNGSSEPTNKPTNPAYVIYTSGSTGKPKGVLIRHRGVISMIRTHRSVFHEDHSSRFSQTAGVSFDAMAFEVWPCLSVGAALCIVDGETRMDPWKLKEWLIQHHITISFQPTMMAQRLLEEQWPRTLTALKALRAAGDKLTAYPTRPYPFRFYNLYGPTEDTIWTTWTEVPMKPEGITDAPSIGKPVANKQVYILGPGSRL